MLTSKDFNKKIGQKHILEKVLEYGLLCSHCTDKIQFEIDAIQDYLENGAEMGVVL